MHEGLREALEVYARVLDTYRLALSHERAGDLETAVRLKYVDLPRLKIEIEEKQLHIETLLDALTAWCEQRNLNPQQVLAELADVMRVQLGTRLGE